MKRMADSGKNATMEVDSDVLENYSTLPQGVGIYEISGPFFFASAKQYCSTLKTIGSKSKVLIIRMRHVPFIDATGIHNLEAVIRELKHGQTKVILSGVNSEVLKELEKHHLPDLLGREMILSSFDQAITKVQEL